MSIEGQGNFFTIYFPGFVCFVLPRYQVSVYRTIGPLVLIVVLPGYHFVAVLLIMILPEIHLTVIVLGSSFIVALPGSPFKWHTLMEFFWLLHSLAISLI